MKLGMYIYSILILLIAGIRKGMETVLPLRKNFFHPDRKLSFISSQLSAVIFNKPTAVFFCSSAGEFEQAKPMIKALSTSYQSHVFFFSQSGVEFARARGETVSYSLAPLDTVWNWHKLLKHLRPKYSFVIRHEIWPAFVFSAKEHGKVLLLNYSSSSKPGVLKRLVLRMFDQIFCISENTAIPLSGILKPSHIHVTGDTKVDRVIQRSANGRGIQLQLPWQDQKKKVLVMGSAWLEDLKIVLPAFRRVFAEDPMWRLVICPHEVDRDSIDKIQSYLKTHHQEFLMWSLAGDSQKQPLPNCLLIDKLGILAELYALADACFIGGACHHRVHNVLEPAIFGLSLAHGPKFSTSPEARELVHQGFTRIVSDSESAFRWLDELSRLGFTEKANRRLSILKMGGAVNSILKVVERSNER